MKKHRMASLVVLLGGCLVAACQKEGGWQEYKYPDDGFAISAPSRPVRMPPVAGESGKAYGIDYGNRTTILITIGLVSDFAENVPAEEVLQRMKNLTLRGTVSKLVSEQQLSLDGNPGIEYEFQAERWHARQRIFVVKDKLLGVESTAYGDNPLTPDTGRIFDSLRLL